jgi:hypothetical protein
MHVLPITKTRSQVVDVTILTNPPQILIELCPYTTDN